MSPVVKSYRSMKLAYWLVGLTFLLLPWAAIRGKALPILMLFILLMLKMVYYREKGASFVVMAIALCIPFVARMDDSTGSLFANHFKWLNRAIYISILSIYLIFLSRKNFFNKRYIPIKALIVISICFFVDGFRFSFGEGFSQIYTILTVYIMFYISYRGKEDWIDIFQMFTIFFSCLAIYAVLDFLQIGPYELLQQGALWSFSDFFRTGSLLGNSLLFTGFLTAYHTILFIDCFITKSFSPWLLTLSLLVILFTGSRTAFVVIAVIWFLFIVYLNRGLKSQGRVIGIMLFVVIILLGFVTYYLGDYLTMLTERFSEGSDHRASGIQTTMNIVSAHPLGLGYKGVGDVLELYAADGWSASMKTVDNIYLTLVITSGIFFIIPFLFYYYIPLKAFRQSFRNRNYRIAVMLFVPYLLCGLTFNINSFIQLNVLYFGMAGHIFRIIQRKSLYGLVNNNC